MTRGEAWIRIIGVGLSVLGAVLLVTWIVLAAPPTTPTMNGAGCVAFCAPMKAGLLRAGQCECLSEPEPDLLEIATACRTLCERAPIHLKVAETGKVDCACKVGVGTMRLEVTKEKRP